MNQLSFFEPQFWSVSDLTHYVRDLFESDFSLQDLWVQGEVSNVNHHSSGHLYFTLKDSSCSLRCVMWRNNVARLRSIPRDGQAIEVHGAIGVYETLGQYQLYADQIRLAGEGLLFQEFMRLKARLEAEGLFAAERKRAIPRWPHTIGIVTSPTGAALRDMLNTIRRRYALALVVLSPTLVQGSDAPTGIVAALERLPRLARPDVIIVARGGGSIEDLWAFNDERVARAICGCPVPVISGVGHETDFTIADFVCDLRAPTPTAAAELATPNRVDLASELQGLSERLGLAAGSAVNSQRWSLNHLENRLVSRSPAAQIRGDRQRMDHLTHRAGAALSHRIELRQAQLAGLHQRLGALNPAAVLSRGFSVITDSAGRVVRSVGQPALGDHLTVHLPDGRLGVSVESKQPDGVPHKRAPKGSKKETQ